MLVSKLLLLVLIKLSIKTSNSSLETSIVISCNLICSIVCPVISPLVLLVGSPHQSSLKIMIVGSRTVIVVPATGLSRSRAGGSSMMRSLWRTVAKPTDIAVSCISKSIVHLLLSKVESLLWHDPYVTSLHGKHGKVASIPQTAPL